MNSHPKVFTVTAPSGTGKTTLNRQLVAEFAEIEMSISYTTRQQRRNETNGDHYWFISQEEFDRQIKKDLMLEWAKVFDYYYGTSLQELKRIAKGQKIALLEIDVQGWLQAKEKLPEAKSIFIFPPSISDLWARLNARATDSLENRLTRLETARQELSYAHIYDYFILNDNLNSAYQELKKAFYQAKKLNFSKSQGLEHAKNLILEFDKADWIKNLRKKNFPLKNS